MIRTGEEIDARIVILFKEINSIEAGYSGEEKLEDLVLSKPEGRDGG